MCAPPARDSPASSLPNPRRSLTLHFQKWMTRPTQSRPCSPVFLRPQVAAERAPNPRRRSQRSGTAIRPAGPRGNSANSARNVARPSIPARRRPWAFRSAARFGPAADAGRARNPNASWHRAPLLARPSTAAATPNQPPRRTMERAHAHCVRRREGPADALLVMISAALLTPDGGRCSRGRPRRRGACLASRREARRCARGAQS
jgi:hypothetical protein